MAKVIFQNVGKACGPGQAGPSAIKDLNLEIEDGEFLVLVGPPDCDKSAVIRMIAGLEGPIDGDLVIGQLRINGLTSKDRDVSMVFQDHPLYPHLSVYENMAFALKLRKFSMGEIKKHVTDAAATLDLTDLLDRKAETLSHAQRQRVAIGCAVARQPKVFLFDNPLAGLEDKSRSEMRNELIRLHKRLEATMVYVTTDLVEAMAMGTRIAVMNGGEIQQVDVLTKLYNEPTNLFVAGFLGCPPMNFIHGTVSGSDEKILFKEDHRGTIEMNLRDHPGAEKCVGGKVVMGVRPEHCRVILPGAPSEKEALKALADLIEPMGAETLFHLQTGAHSLLSRNAGLVEPSSVGHRVQFTIAPENVHLFDPASTLRIV
jgi:multiple sugar transport system ATP-binding protein